jgi:hypothetical protein
MNNTKELQDLYYSLGNFIYVYLQKHQIDKTKMISNGLICAIRDTTMERMRSDMDLLVDELINRNEPNVSRGTMEI